jgi:hypothetical protein
LKVKNRSELGGLVANQVTRRPRSSFAGPVADPVPVDLAINQQLAS